MVKGDKMKNLYYILKDYEKLKKSEYLKSSTLIKIRIFVSVPAILLMAIFAFLGYWVLAVIACVIFLSIIFLNARKYEMYFSMFGTLSKINKGTDIEKSKRNANNKRESGGFFLEKIKKIKERNKIKIFDNILQWWERILLEDAEFMKTQSEKMYDTTPDWFESFLREKGINENNIDLLIDELSIKYDYVILKAFLNVAPWVIAFLGIDYIKRFPWDSTEFISIFIISSTLIIYSIYFAEDRRISKKAKIYPLINIKRNKEELLHDLKLMKMKWNTQNKK